MSTKWGFRCPKCQTSSDHWFNHGEEVCKEILANWKYVKPLRDYNGWIEVDILGGFGNDVFSFMDEHFEHGLEIENEYGGILNSKPLPSPPDQYLDTEESFGA